MCHTAAVRQNEWIDSLHRACFWWRICCGSSSLVEMQLDVRGRGSAGSSVPRKPHWILSLLHWVLLIIHQRTVHLKQQIWEIRGAASRSAQRGGGTSSRKPELLLSLRLENKFLVNLNAARVAWMENRWLTGNTGICFTYVSSSCSPRVAAQVHPWGQTHDLRSASLERHNPGDHLATEWW